MTSAPFMGCPLLGGRIVDCREVYDANASGRNGLDARHASSTWEASTRKGAGHVLLGDGELHGSGGRRQHRRRHAVEGGERAIRALLPIAAFPILFAAQQRSKACFGWTWRGRARRVPAVPDARLHRLCRSLLAGIRAARGVADRADALAPTADRSSALSSAPRSRPTCCLKMIGNPYTASAATDTSSTATAPPIRGNRDSVRACDHDFAAAVVTPPGSAAGDDHPRRLCGGLCSFHSPTFRSGVSSPRRRVFWSICSCTGVARSSQWRTR